MENCWAYQYILCFESVNWVEAELIFGESFFFVFDRCMARILEFSFYYCSALFRVFNLVCYLKVVFSWGKVVNYLERMVRVDIDIQFI